MKPSFGGGFFFLSVAVISIIITFFSVFQIV